MADFIYDLARYRIWTQDLDLIVLPIKMMLVSPDYVPTRTHTTVDDGTITCPSEFEVTGTGYVSGFGGSGRKLLANKSFVNDTTGHKTRFFFDTLSWTGLNVGLVGGAILITEEGTSDLTAQLIAYRSSGGFPQDLLGDELQLMLDPELGFF